MAQQKPKKANEVAKVTRQKKLIEHLKKKENWMKWALVATLIIILLLLLFIGYATDWTTGLHKDTSTTPIGTDSSSSKTGTATGSGSTTTPTPGSSSTGTTGGTGGTPSGTGSTSGSGTNTGTNNTSTERSSSNTSSTTNNSTTTNNNTTTTTPTPHDNLLTLYADTNAGKSITDVITQAQVLGIGVECTDNLLIKECTFTAGGASFSTKSVSGIVTSVLGL